MCQEAEIALTWPSGAVNDPLQNLADMSGDFNDPFFQYQQISDIHHCISSTLRVVRTSACCLLVAGKSRWGESHANK